MQSLKLLMMRTWWPSFELRNVHNDEPGMSPMEIWCNEAQERYVLAISRRSLESFKALCERERAIYAVMGEATEEDIYWLAMHCLIITPVDMSDGYATRKATENAARCTA